MIYGYARVSTEHQNLDRQIEELLKYGINEKNKKRWSINNKITW